MQRSCKIGPPFVQMAWVTPKSWGRGPSKGIRCKGPGRVNRICQSFSPSRLERAATDTLPHFRVLLRLDRRPCYRGHDLVRPRRPYEPKTQTKPGRRRQIRLRGLAHRLDPHSSPGGPRRSAERRRLLPRPSTGGACRPSPRQRCSPFRTGRWTTTATWNSAFRPTTARGASRHGAGGDVLSGSWRRSTRSNFRGFAAAGPAGSLPESSIGTI